MGKKSRLKRERRDAATRTNPTHRAVTEATYRVVDALEAYDRVLRGRASDLNTLALPEDLQAIAQYAATGDARRDAHDMSRAWRIIDDELPVLGALPHSLDRANESHRRWRGPLTPRQLLNCAIDAPEGSGTYREHLAANTAFFEERDEKQRRRQDEKCGRQTKGGAGCSGYLVYMPTPDGDFDPNYGCRLHLTDDEHDAMSSIYRAAQRNHDCPGCQATAGHPCYTGENDARNLRLVNGEWARKYKYKDLTVHDARLHLAASAQH